MKQLVAVVAFAALGLLGLSSTRADAIPACLPKTESLGLIPTGASYNGRPGTLTSGFQYTTDAGVQFYMGDFASLDVVPVSDSPECPDPVQEITITVLDPWSGEPLTLSVRPTP